MSRQSSAAARQASARRHSRLRFESLEERRVMALAIAENLLVNLDARDASAATAVWDNTGSLAGDFARFGNPQYITLGPNANPAVNLNPTNGTTDYYRGPASTAGITGNGTRSIEVWAWNPTLDRGEETMVQWGRRGGPAGTNQSFGHGTHPDWGAAGLWGAPDIGWHGTPTAGEWHHLVFTYESNTVRVYSDGVLKNLENHTLATHAGTDILLGAQFNDDGSLSLGQTATLAIANVRIHDGALSRTQIINNYNEDAARFGKPAFSDAAPAPVHRYSFNGTTADSMGNAGDAVVFGGATMVGNQLVLSNTGNSNDAGIQYADLPIDTTIGTNNQLSIEGWFTMDARATWQRVIDFGYNTDRHIFFTPSRDGGGTGPAFTSIRNQPATGDQAMTGPTIEAGVPTHFAMVIDTAGNNQRLYINGQIVAADVDLQGFSPIIYGNSPLNYIGRSFFNDAAFRGRIDEIRIYDEALNGAQVRANFVSGPDLLNVATVAVADAYSVNEGSTISPPQFAVPAANVTAYSIPAGTVGNQVHTGSLGMDFDVTSPVSITHLGVFDSGSDGITTTLVAQLYDRNNTATPLATINFTPGDQGVLEGGSRFKALGTPLNLPVGFQGRIVAYGFDAGNPNGNSGTPTWTTNGDGKLSFSGNSFWLATTAYPTNNDGGPANRYAAGTFKFEGPSIIGPPSLLANDSDANGNALHYAPVVSIVDANFNGNTTPSNMSINRNVAAAGVVQNNRLEMTQAANSQLATAIINKPNPTQLLTGYSASFDVLLGNGTNPPADGVNFVYGSIPDNALFGESYTGTGLQVQINTYNGGGTNQPEFRLVYNGTQLADITSTRAIATPGADRPVSIDVTPGGLVTFKHNHQVIYSVQVPNWAPQADWRFAIGARTGGANEQAFIDNLRIVGTTNGAVTSALGVPVAINADGKFSYDPNSLPQVNPLSAGQTLTDSFNYTVTDGQLISTATANITIVGVNDPVTSANAGTTYTINELQDLVLSGSGVDPDANDVLTYAWDLDSDGQFDDATTANPTVSWSTLTGLAPPVNDNGTRQIRLRVSDPAGTSQIATATLVVNNVAPTVSATAPAQAGLNQPVNFVLSANDAPADMAAGFTYVIDWDDTSANQTILPTANNSPLTVSHAFTSTGTFNVTITAKDKDGATSAVFTRQVVVSQIYEQGGVLFVGGTSANERMIIGPGASGGIQVRINNKIIGTFVNSSSLVVTGGDGNDNITLSSYLTVNATVDGGEGNDYISGGSLADTLIGGPGNDRLFGYGGNDTLLGGDGNDTISGGAANDFIEGGTGNDTLKGDADNDTLEGGDGNDRVSGDAGNDLLRGGEGTDTLDGGTGNDVIAGDNAGDKLHGGAGNDVLIGGELVDTLFGGSGDDLLLGDGLTISTNAALLALLAAWNDPLAGSVAQRSATMNLGVLQDQDGDTLNGESGTDWLLLFINDRANKSDRIAPNVVTES